MRGVSTNCIVTEVLLVCLGHLGCCTRVTNVAESQTPGEGRWLAEVTRDRQSGRPEVPGQGLGVR